MVLKDGTGAVIDVAAGEKEFSKAMAAPEPTGPPVVEAPAPPPVDPEAPYGRTKDGQPKKGPGGRPAKDADKPRVTTAAAATGGEPVDYTKDLAQLASYVHAGMCMMERTHAHAALWKGTTPKMVAAWNTAANKNEKVRSGVELLAGGDTTWVLGVALASLPFVQGAYVLWRDPQSEIATRLADATKADLENAARLYEEQLVASAGLAA